MIKNDVSLADSNQQSLHAANPIVLVCCADNNYSMPLAVMLRSVVENLKSDYQLLVFVIDRGITEQNKKRILKPLDPAKCEVRFLSTETLDKNIRGDELSKDEMFKSEFRALPDYITGTSLYKFIIPEILPAQVEKAIYLDCDLVVRGDLGKLWESNLADNYVLAVRELWIPYIKDGIANYKELGLPGEAKFFNSGVLVLNLKRWRADKISTQLIDHLKRNIEYRTFWDQDTLNTILVEQWGELDPRWNVTPGVHKLLAVNSHLFSAEVRESLLQDPLVVHYASASKPWSTPKTAFYNEFQFKDVFFQYVDLTDWAGWRLTFWRLMWAKLGRKWRSLKSAQSK
jgi:lipopolysaccharide biosynthesis glycosyltransferase